MDVPYLPVLSQSWQTVHFKNKIITVKFVVLANIAVICSITNTASPWGPSLHDTLQHILASLNNNRMQKGVFLPNEEQKLYLCLTEKWSATATTKYIYYIHMPLYINIYGCIKPQPNWSSNEEWMRIWGKKYNQGGFFSTFSRHMLEQHNTALEPLQPWSWDLWQQLLLKWQTFSSRGFLTWTTRDVLFSCQLQKMHVSQEISRGSASDECHTLQQYRSLSSVSSPQN